MNTQVNKALSLVESRLNALLEAFISSPTAARAPNAALELLDADDVLTGDLKVLWQHQQNFSRLSEKRDEAQKLEERVKATVQEVVDLGDEITNAAHLDDRDATDSEEEDDEHQQKNPMYSLPPVKKVDYHILLSLARRISRHDESRVIKPFIDIPASLKSDNPDQHTTLNNVAVDSLPPETRYWLLETESLLYESAKVPFPTEERIRMGVMGRLQSAHVDGAGADPDKEVEKMMRVSAQGLQPGYPDGSPAQGLEHDIGFGYEARPGAEPNGDPSFKPAVFDLDVYDPNEDDEDDE